jgi:hypothetical protein
MHAKMTFDDGKNPLEDPTTFSQGRLKVLLIDGVIYRYMFSNFHFVEAWGHQYIVEAWGAPTHCKEIVINMSINKHKICFHS